MSSKQWSIPAIALVLAALAVGGCSGPSPTPKPLAVTPQEAVIGYWQAIDRGDYETAYDLAYHDANVTRQEWVGYHKAMWGENGTGLTIYNFTVVGTSTLDPGTFAGNFTQIDAVVVQTDVSYYGTNSSGISQFTAVETTEGWKFFGAY